MLVPVLVPALVPVPVPVPVLVLVLVLAQVLAQVPMLHAVQTTNALLASAAQQGKPWRTRTRATT